MQRIEHFLRKKLNTVHILIIISGLLMLTACEKTEKVDNFPRHQSKLVANCIFKPGLGFQFKLYKSLSPIDNAPFRELSNPKAYIRIFENNILFDSLTYHAYLTSSFFSGDSNKRAKANTSYRFECYYPGFDKVSAEDYLPDSANIQKINGYYTVLNSYGSNDTSINDASFFTNVNIDLGHAASHLIIQIQGTRANYKGPYYNNYGAYIYELTDLNSSNSSEWISNSLYVTNSSGVKILI